MNKSVNQVVNSYCCLQPVGGLFATRCFDQYRVVNSQPASASQNAGWWVAVCNSFSEKRKCLILLAQKISFCSLKKSHFAHPPTLLLFTGVYPFFERKSAFHPDK